MSFRPRQRDELLRLSDEKIIEYSVAARDAGEREAFTGGVEVFVWRRLPMVETMVKLKIKQSEDRENVIQDVMVSTLESAPSLRGSHPGEVVNWIKRITACRIADHIARRVREREHEFSADAPRGDGDDGWLPEVADLNDEQGAVGTAALVSGLLDERNERHRRAIELRMRGYPSLEVVEILGEEAAMTRDSVDQAFSRFRKDLRKELEDSRG